MLFIVSKTSNHIYDEHMMDLEDYNEYISEKKKPCEEAKLINCIINNYGIDNQNRWCVELSTTEDIINFINKNGKIIINKSEVYDIPTIEIYDSWRE